MKKLISLLTVTGLSAMPSMLMAHGTHDHSAIFAAGEAHPAAGMEHAILLAVITAVVYLSLKFFRK
jgi:hydrogenase/urease accessory protein HupE